MHTNQRHASRQRHAVTPFTCATQSMRAHAQSVWPPPAPPEKCLLRICNACVEFTFEHAMHNTVRQFELVRFNLTRANRCRERDIRQFLYGILLVWLWLHAKRKSQNCKQSNNRCMQMNYKLVDNCCCIKSTASSKLEPFATRNRTNVDASFQLLLTTKYKNPPWTLVRPCSGVICSPINI